MDPEIRQTSPTTQKRLPGLSAKTILIPAMVVVLSMHVLIVFNTLRINRAGQRVSQTMEANFNYAQTVNAFGGISDALTDLARSFVSTGNVSYLRAYREMVEQERQRNVDAAPRLEAQSEAGYELLMEAVGAAQERMLLDYHAMHLASEYYCTNIDAWPELTEDELLERRGVSRAAFDAGLLQALYGEFFIEFDHELYIPGGNCYGEDTSYCLQNMPSYTDSARLTLDRYGRLVCIARVSSMAGGDSYDCMIPVLWCD